MKDGKHPNPNTIHPIAGYDKEIYVKPTITNPNIIVGDFTYIADSDFESHVSHLYEWNDDKLIIGKFCQIAAGVEFVMNGANHQMNAVSTFPFYTLEGWEMSPPAKADLPLKGDTVIENDVWIGQNSVILPGVHMVKDKKSVNAALLENACVNAKAKAGILAKASGVTLGDLISIDYNWGELHLFSQTQYDMEDDCMRMASAAPTSIEIEPDDIDISDSVTFVWEISK